MRALLSNIHCIFERSAAMRIKISKWGNSAGIRLPRETLAAAGLTVGQEVELSTKAGVVELRPLDRPVRLAELVAEAKRLGPANIPSFEDWGILPSEWPVEDWSDVAPKARKSGMTNAGDKRKTAGRG